MHACDDGCRGWEALARAYLSPVASSGGASDRGKLVDVGETAAWLRSECGKSYVPSFVADALSWRGTRAWEEEIATTTRVRLVALVPPAPTGSGNVNRRGMGMGMGELDFVRRRFLPTLLACVEMLEKAAVEAGIDRMHRKVVDVTYVAHPARRELPPQPGTPILPEHVNGGVTFMGTGRVLVYRREDACKVLIHELLHLYGYDRLLRYDHEAEAGLMRVLGVAQLQQGSGGGTAHFGLSECYVDALACYLHAFTNVSRRATVVDLEAVDSHLSAAAARILLHYGRKPRALLHPPVPVMTEGTHACSYYLCKAALWRDIGEFVRTHPPWVIPQNPAAFAKLVEGAVRLWRPSAEEMRAARASRSLRMTPPP